MNIITSPTWRYSVGDRLGGTETFNLYECTLPDKKKGILKIALTVEYNGSLDREAFILQTLWEQAEQIEAEALKTEPEKGELGYRNFFPELIESFIADDQGDRQVTILGLSHIAEELSELAPLEHLMSREHVRVDPKTSVWIMGKLLKLLDFAHRQGISVMINGDNILINRDKHIVTIFDWSESTIIGGGPIAPTIASEEISQVAREVIAALGGNLETGELPADDQLTDEWYQKLLWNLAGGHHDSAGEAHTYFYRLVRSIWPSKFHPFTAYPVRIRE